jgi:hypothetical protein
VHVVRRILVLVAISVTGIALLAPLAARSAAPVPAPIEEHLLSVEGVVPLSAVNRGTTDRGAAAGREVAAEAPASDAAEALDPAPVPTPASAPMEATLYSAAAPAAPAAPRVTYSGTSVWDDLAQCESGGNWAINTGNGYYGGLQFSYGTWHGYGGGEFAEYPHQATREEQIIVAERLHAARGYSPWPACRSKLGLP